jgi:protein O-mannosyl-transferase
MKKNTGIKAPHKVQKHPAKPPAKSQVNNTRRIWALTGGLALLTLIAFIPAIHNDFITTWDDNEYVTSNPFIRSLSLQNIKTIFSQYVVLNYHPLTMLSFAIDYQRFGLHPSGYHVTSIIIHILDAILLFYLCFRLSGKVVIGAIAALLFAIHPMHVESVAWISGRKDVLYVFWYLAALIAYLNYAQHENGKIKFALLTAIFFIFSLLSKPMAVTLPVSLLLIDYLKGRKWKQKAVAEKVFFMALFFISIGFGIMGILSQKSAGAVHVGDDYSLPDRILLVCHFLITYLWKMILPINLSAFYPYPQKSAGIYPAEVYFSALLVLMLTGVLVWKFKKILADRTLVFGILFFLLNIILSLQIIPIGGAAMADRFTYLSSTGLFFIAATLINNYNEKHSGFSFLTMAFTVYLIALTYLTHERSKVWHNNKTLWADAYHNAPGSRSLNKLGYAYKEENKPDSALECFSRSITLQHDNPDAYALRAQVYNLFGKYDLAIQDCDSSLKYRADNPNAFVNRARAYAGTGKYDIAMSDLRKALRVNSSNFNDSLPVQNIYNDIANVYSQQGKLDSAFVMFSRSISIDAQNPVTYRNRAVIEYQQGNLAASLNDLNQSLRLDPDNIRSREMYSLVDSLLRAKKQ